MTKRTQDFQNSKAQNEKIQMTELSQFVYGNKFWVLGSF
jgi:hypothetical protein